MIHRQTFKTEDLIKIPSRSLEDTLTSLLSHIVRAASTNNKEQITLIRQALREIDLFIVETCIEDRNQSN